MATRRVIEDEAGLIGRKDRVLHVRFSVSECQRIDVAAAGAGLTVSGFLRALCLEGAGVRPFLTDDDRAIFAALASDMHAVGVNLNRLARAANSAGRIAPGNLDPALADVQKLVAAIAIELRELGRRGAQRHRGA
ncbi:plasmid mobilization relaxosome protein MobC [Metarhizobium album]|uniref:Plasmid mobilization relaxosome protein MobC n=1 Tax=Metarhizobium album TaxID=2182425 RepID=A0A2U2DK36_9HYPH|nr:plasmid mobilization relaxosome protein MobC [Rhizobium album]PWE53679.1 plasmid mobilization relaxosome protein MobC [Rhizobium album]